MGLRVSHGCWEGSYSTFSDWRSALADAAGFPPLVLMEGYYDERQWVGMLPKVRFLETQPLFLKAQGQEQPIVGLKRLPIRWDYFKEDYLTVLLLHSDSEGQIEAALCGPLADRLEELIPKLPEVWQQYTRKFIDGLRRARESGQAVEFA
jgi:hypothetical protein